MEVIPTPAAGRTFDLSRLEPHDVLELGSRMRLRSQGATSFPDVAQRLVSVLFEALETPTQQPAVVLGRIYRTITLDTLEPESRKFASELLDGPDDVDPASIRCLNLIGTRGILAEWNDAASSRGHLAIPLADAAAVQRLPMVAELIRQLGVSPDDFVSGRFGGDDESRIGRRFRGFYVEHALGSSAVPAQTEFVQRYGVESVIGFGGEMPDGELFAGIVFTRVPVAPEVAEVFEILAPFAELSFIDCQSREAWDVDRRMSALEALVHLQDTFAIQQSRRLAGERDRARVESNRLLEIRNVELETYASKLERSQRATLNVIDDLRAARADLEVRVVERTHELAVAIEELERRNTELKEFVYIASHDLQEPLRTISGYLQLIERRYGERLDEDGREFIQFAVDGAHHLQELIEGLLRYSRATTATQRDEPVALKEVVDDALRNLTVLLETDRTEVELVDLDHNVLGDYPLMVQLIQNLVSNAVKFSTPPAHVTISARRDGEMVVVDVADEGRGFDPRHKERIFTIFRRLQRDVPGTGIGLAICRKIVENHGGTISADSAPGKGTTMTFSLRQAKDHHE